MATPRAGRRKRTYVKMNQPPKEVWIISKEGEGSNVIAPTDDKGNFLGVTAFRERICAQAWVNDWAPYMFPKPVIEGPFSLPWGLINRLGIDQEFSIWMELTLVNHEVFLVTPFCKGGAKFLYLGESVLE